jgi:hypothetical protein
VERGIAAPGQLSAQLDARLSHCQYTAGECGNFRNLDSLTTFEELERIAMVQVYSLQIRGIEIHAGSLAHILQDDVVLLIKRFRERQIRPSRDSRDIQQDPVAVIDEMRRYGSHTITRSMDERQLSQLYVGHELDHGARDKCVGFNGLDYGTWSFQRVLG